MNCPPGAAVGRAAPMPVRTMPRTHIQFAACLYSSKNRRIDIRYDRDFAWVDFFGVREVGAREVGAREVGAREVGAREVGAREVGAREVGVREVGARFTSPPDRQA